MYFVNSYFYNGNYRIHVVRVKAYLVFIIMFVKSVTVQSLLYNAYSQYGSLTAGEIERLRVKHRLKVVQSLEDGLGRNIIRSIIGDGYFKQEDLMVRSHATF